MNRRVFFDKVRLEPFRGALSQWTVVGCNAILDEWQRRGLTDLRWLAYMLATVRGECGPNMMPVREGFKKTDAESRAFVTRQGYRYAVDVNGHVYYGRGLVQITHYDNYVAMGKILKVDLANNPDLALRPDIAVKIMFEGMIRGTFTGKKLSDYFNDSVTDWTNARKIINGLDKAAQFATWGRQFHVALIEADLGVEIPAPPDIAPIPVPKPKPPAHPAAKPAIGAAIIAALVAAGAFVQDHPFIVFGVVAAAIAIAFLIWRK